MQESNVLTDESLLSELQKVRRKFREYAATGFWVDKNTFLKSDDIEVKMAKLKGDNGKLTEKPMIILKKAVIMTVNRNGRIISVKSKPAFGVWAQTADKALKCLDSNAELMYSSR